MEILRVFNNNVVLAKDSSQPGPAGGSGTGGEVIVTGRGIGFKAHPGQTIDPSKIVRVFIPSDGRDPDHMAELLSDIPLTYIKLLTEAMSSVGLDTTASQSPTLLMALADHVHLAVTRTQRNQTIEYPLRNEVAALYGDEFRLAESILAFVNDKLANDANSYYEGPLVQLPESEAIALAMHLVNAGFATGDLSFTYTMTGVLQQLISVIEQFYEISLEDDTVSVGRFITHLRYLFVRIRNNTQLEDEQSEIGQAIRQTDPQAYQCAQTLASIIELRTGDSLTEDEVSYLTLHVKRIKSTNLRKTPLTDRKENNMITRTATIGSSVGLHARPASLFTAAVADTDLDITISFDGEEADAASILEVMTLGAKHGDVVTLTCEDDSATAQLDELAAMLERDLDAE